MLHDIAYIEDKTFINLYSIPLKSCKERPMKQRHKSPRFKYLEAYPVVTFIYYINSMNLRATRRYSSPLAGDHDLV
ncbi:hypothetical protein IC007_0569 [Sulfuracidifex tepidarius]|uniref:Uncharacterized protein n=1 Tax=Sulfuracidifex tepidarius TaxID=1294262 RepID=A0A510E0P6_9CREN|nr:hypothetical protein IC007_0569 [Sulfuracidifex tepidarius]